MVVSRTGQIDGVQPFQERGKSRPIQAGLLPSASRYIQHEGPQAVLAIQS
jgi:hypothetical protein